MIRILLIDNYDSFTYNIWMYLSEIPYVDCTVVKNDDLMSSEILTKYDGVVLSPGPGNPEVNADVGICREIVKSVDKPILGICLGHQLIGSVFGADVVPAPNILHGRTSRVRHYGDRLFRGITSSFRAVRYHSLSLSGVVEPLEIIAQDDDGVPMAIRHIGRPIWGVQFHPESILTDGGRVLLQNFVEIVLESKDLPPDRIVGEATRCVWMDVPGNVDGQATFDEFCGSASECFWLDSSDSAQGRFSIIGGVAGSRSTTVSYRVVEGVTQVTTHDGSIRTFNAEIFEFMKSQQCAIAVEQEELLPFEFRPGFVGYFGYELGSTVESAPILCHSHLPDGRFLLTDRYVVIDHVEDRVYLLFLTGRGWGNSGDAQTWFTEAASSLARLKTERAPVPPITPNNSKGFVFRDNREDYLKKIMKCKEYLTSGDSYELCLTNSASIAGEFDASAAYMHLRAASPVPYGAFLRTPTFSVLSASPERFMTISGDRNVRVSPIKGTRRRGSDAHEDAVLKVELETDEKEIAENLMIVDLMRHDLSRVSEVGSVRPVELFAVYTFATVHQMVSTIESTLRADVTPLDCIKCALPPGSMTGAPKLRSIEILNELEEEPRGVYSGVLGWVSLNGRADLSVVIRTLVVEEGSATFGVGGAITLLSDPVAEYAETLVKAAAPAAALGVVFERQ